MNNRFWILVAFVLILPVTLLVTVPSRSEEHKPGFFNSLVKTLTFSSDKKRYPIQNWKTPTQGIPVYFMAIDTLPMIDLQIIFDAGSARDGDKLGIASLCANLLEEGTTDLNANQIAQRFENVGALYVYEVEKDRASFGMRSLSDPDHFNEVLPHFEDVVTKPSFMEANVNRVKTQTIVSLKQELQDPGVVAERAFYKALYQKQPYSNPVLGTEDGVKAITPADLKAFHQKYYTAKNAVIVLSGNINREKAEFIAESMAKKLPEGTSIDPIPKPEEVAKAEEFTIPFTSTQSHIIIGQLGRAAGDKDRFSLQVGNYILGAGPLVARLFKEIRDKHGLVYGVRSYFVPLKEKGPFMISLETKNSQAKEALTHCRELLKDFVEKGPTDDEVATAKKSIVASFPLRISTNSDIANTLAEIAFYKLPLDFLNEYIANVDKVTTAQVKEAFKRRIQPDKEVTVIVGEADEVK